MFIFCLSYDRGRAQTYVMFRRGIWQYISSRSFWIQVGVKYAFICIFTRASIMVQFLQRIVDTTSTTYCPMCGYVYVELRVLWVWEHRQRKWAISRLFFLHGNGWRACCFELARPPRILII